MFALWGRVVYRRRIVVLILSLVLLAGTGVVLAQGGEFRDNTVSRGEASQGIQLVTNELPRASNSSFALVFTSQRLSTTDSAFKEAMLAALAPLRSDHRIVSITTPYNAPLLVSGLYQSRNGHQALANILVRDRPATARHYYAELRGQVHSATLDVVGTGPLGLNSAFDSYLQSDLRRAEIVSLPLVLLFLLLVFGTVVAAVLPLGVGVLAIIGGVASVFLLTRVTDVSNYALNIVTLVGLGVAVDYSLFIVNRFREELSGGTSVEESIVTAIATAGRAITFSGITVAVGLSGLFFFQGTFLASMGLAGAIVVLFAVLYALTFLPALLCLIGTGVNRWRLPLPQGDSGQVWHRLAMAVMKRPIPVLLVTVPVILLAGSPFLNLRLANGGVWTLPPSSEAYRGYQTLVHGFPGQDQTQISVIVHYRGGNPLASSRVGELFRLTKRLQSISGVSHVESLTTLAQGYTASAYQKLYSGSARPQSDPIRKAIHESVGRDIVVLSVFTHFGSASDDARAIVRRIRDIHTVGDGSILVTGETALDIDTINVITEHIPAALTYVVVMTYIVLFLLLGSVILPLKAVITDFLSISASFGALVWIFQQGHLQDQLQFTPASLDPSVPVLLFCIVFGLSMDYEVLLLSRIKEIYVRDGDNREAVARGLEKSGRLITGAAAIMVSVFLAFGLANIVIIKAIGLGMAIAVAVDATIVRALIVPATMRLLGRYNWWAPGPLARLAHRLHLGEEGTVSTQSAVGD